jgi:paired small multidrug resistance pump
MEFIYNSAGIIGVILIMIAFLFLQIGKISAQSIHYSLLNIFGASGILISLLYEWNLSAFLMESSWLVISLYGLFRAIRMNQKSKPIMSSPPQ